MSSAEAGPRRNKVRGFTMIEVMVTMAMLSMMALVIERTLSSVRNADLYLDATRRAKERAEQVTYSLHEAVGASRKVFGRDEMGLAYLEAMDLSRWPLDSQARLPLFDEAAPLGPDRDGVPSSGNLLLFVRESDPIVCAADADAGKRRYVDIYHFVCCYPSPAPRQVISDVADQARDLVVLYSTGYPSYTQLLDIRDESERQNVVAQLYREYGFRYAWDANELPDAAFHALDEAGHISAPPTPAFEIPIDQDLSRGGHLIHCNAQLAPTSDAHRARQAVFAAVETGGWRPDGFEVKVVGGSGHRKVWLRVTVETQATRGKSAVHASTLIASVRDL